ncbi:FCD domain-containing protein [Sodalis ligni]|jgi:DNA-binding GntR family transcriptional regulator|uniref:FCD domain-containing protein n=1 Tax=Sodalis TaxID=84565 RepID=UPI00193FB460|nr:FCD domain-containing protein [Sodalis ligni]QWA10926.1 FCD domain-containing protein [Sodalis ligni]
MSYTADSIQVLRSATLCDLVQEEILRRIKTRQLVAGMKLNEMELAEHLQISRSPVREAFRALEEAGLVSLEKNRGAWIRDISEQEAAELYEVRAGLDEIAGRRLASIVTEDQLQELHGVLDQLEAISQHDDVNNYFLLNIAFHDRVVEMAGNATLLTLYRQVINRMHLIRRQGLALSGSSQASHAEHRMILAALAARDPDAVAHSMRQHIQQGYQRACSAQNRAL